MLPFLSITGISLFLIIFYFSGRKYPSFIYLGLFFFLISLYAFYQYILLYSKSEFLVSIFLFNIAIICSPLYLIGPMLYWYIRSVLTDNARLQRRDFWHLVPMIIFFFAALPHAFLPWHEKVEAARVGLIGLLMSPFFFPSILYGMPQLPASKPDMGKGEKSETLISESMIKTQLRMEKSYLDSISMRVNAYMKESKPYLQPELNLSQVSVQLSIPVHHLSYYFKEVKKQPFHDFRNEWRIHHTQKLISNGKINQMTLEAIGLSLGFSNRNAFQRVEGIAD